MLKYLAETVNFLRRIFYRKPTFTGLFTNFHSSIPLAYKRSLVSCLLYIEFLTSVPAIKNFTFNLKLSGNMNGFPSHMFDPLFRRFLDNIFKPKPTVHTVPKKIVYFCPPFAGSHSLKIRKQTTRLCSAAYPHVNIRQHSWESLL